MASVSPAEGGSIELSVLAPPTPSVGDAVDPTSTEALRESEAVGLHPVDEGFHAWLFVFSAFILECLVWGFPFSFGIFQQWYLTHPPFNTASEASLNSVGTVTIAIQYSEGLLALWVARRYPQYLRTIMKLSLVVCSATMALSSFSTKVWHLILLQGAVYGFAGGFLYTPVIVWLSEWFVKRRSLAGSFIFGGSGLGGAAFPLGITYLLESVGFRWTLRIYALVLLVFGGLATLGTKARLPVAGTAGSRKVDYSFSKTPLFVMVAMTIFTQGLAFFVVALYIPSYAASLGYSRLDGTIALSVFNLSSVGGQILFGYYCDYKPFTGVMVFSGIVSSVLAYTLWGFAHDIKTVFIFVVLFGSISGGFSSIWPPASAEVDSAQTPIVFMLFAMSKGLSAISGPLIAAALHPKKLSHDQVSSLRPGAIMRNGWGGFGFTGITIFVGSAMAATTAMSLASTILRKRLSQERPTNTA